MARTLAPLIFSLLGFASQAPAQVPIAQRIADHPYLSHVSLERVADADPFEFYVQLPSKAEPELLAETIEAYLPWLQEIARIVEDDYLAPAGLQLDSEPVGVVLLASRGDYENFLRGGGVRWSYEPGGGWDPALRAVVGYQDCYGSPRPVYRQRGPLLRDAVLGLLAPLTEAGLRAPGSEWFVGGLAQSLGYHFGRKPSCLPDTSPDRKALAVLRAYVENEPMRKAYWFDLQALLQPKDAAGLKSWARAWTSKTFGSNGSDTRSYRASLPWALRLQSWEWIRFLQHGEEGRYQVYLPELLAMGLAGELNEAGLLALLEIDDGELLVGQFHSYLDQACAKVLRKPPVFGATAKPEARIASKPAAKRKSKPEAKPTEAASESSNSASFDPTTIEVSLDTAQMHLACALDWARQDRLEEALEQLQEGLAMDAEDSALLRATEQIQALLGVRQGWIEDLVARKGKLRLKVNGKSRAFDVVGLEAGKLIFGRARDGVKDLALVDLSTQDLLTNLTKKWSNFGPEWSRVFAQLLTGDEDWARQARGAGAQGEHMLAGQDKHADLLQLGECLRLAQWLSSQKLPEDEGQIHFVYERLMSLRGLAEGVPQFESKLVGMREYARVLLEGRNRHADPKELFMGPIESLGEDRYRLSYDFSNIRQLRDFESGSEALLGMLNSTPSSLPESRWGTEVREGMLRVRGRGALVHRLRFTGEVKVTYRYGIFHLDGTDSALTWFLIGGHWNEEQSSLFGSMTACGLWAAGPTGRHQETDPKYQLPMNEGMDPDEVSVACDGKGGLLMTRGSRSPISLNTEDLPNQGHAYLGYNTALELRIDELTIEGHVSPAGWQSLWDAHNSAELDAAGF